MDRYVGTRIREYEILETVGEGGMGAVYRARHLLLGSVRAIKVIHGHLADDPRFVQRFIREASILNQLNHPNLVQLYEFGQLEENTFFMVLEFIEGESLKSRIARKGKLSVREAVPLIQQAARGLHSAHEKGIVHRDISPDNLMIVKDRSGAETTKVIDFGIAKPLEETQLTATHAFVGKLQYCSPEQCGFLKDEEVIDHRSDIYSLAITLYQTLSGKLPFHSTTPEGYLYKHLTEQPRPLSQVVSVSAAIDRLILKALSKDRNHRQISMLEFHAELQTLDPGESASQSTCDFESPAVTHSVVLTPTDNEKTEVTQAGENRFVTVMFADLSGSAALSASLDPEEVADLMTGCIERFARLTEFYEGTADKVAGDCVMAVFGSKKVHEDDALRALFCATDMLQELSDYGQEIGLPLQVSIGVNCGVVFAGQGSGSTHPFTVTGEAVNVAQRLQTTAAAGEVLVSDRIYRLTRDAGEFSSVSTVSLKSSEKPFVAYRLTGLKRGLEFQMTFHEGALLGRESEVEVVRQCLDQLDAGTGGVLSVKGESGIGKTRLSQEIAKLVEERKFGILSGHPRSFGRGWVFSPFQNLFHAEEFQRFMRDSEEKDSALLERLSGSVAPNAEERGEMDEETRFRILSLLLRFLRAKCANAPIVLVLDDLHFADSATVSLIRELIESIVDECPVLFCVLYRPDLQPPWLSHPLNTELVLSPLAPEAVAGLVEHYLGAPAPGEIEKLMTDRCEGNPLYVLEFLELLRESGSLKNRNGNVVLDGNPEDIAIPDTLRSLIATRLDLLQPKSLDALKMGSVIGRRFSYRLLRKAVAEGRPLQQILEEILSRRLLVASRVPEVEYVFRTAVLWEVTYSTLSRKQLRKFHDVAALTIESVHAGQLPAYFDALSYHFRKAGNNERASFYAHKAMDRALALGDLLTGAAYARELLNADSVSEKQQNVRLQLCEILIQAGDFAEAESLLKELKGGGELSGDEEQARLMLAEGTIVSHVGSLQEAASRLTVALEFCMTHHLDVLASWIESRLAFVFFRAGDHENAREHLKRGLELAREVDQKAVVARCLEGLANLEAEEGNEAEAEDHYLQALEVAEVMNARVMGTNLLLNLAILHQDAGRLGIAEERLRQARDMAAAIGNIRLFPYVAYNLGEIRFLQGKVDDARQIFTDASGLASRYGEAEVKEASDLYLLYLNKNKEGLEHLVSGLTSPDHKALGYYLLSSLLDKSGFHTQAQECRVQVHSFLNSSKCSWLERWVAENRSGEAL